VVDDQAKEREMSLRRAKPDNDGVLAGKVAMVTTLVPGGPVRGEVVVQVRGGGETYMAVSDGPVAVGCEVLVVEDRGGRTLFVSPL
jgi:membrane-bound ClpP family serine protease